MSVKGQNSEVALTKVVKEKAARRRLSNLNLMSRITAAPQRD